MTVMSKLNVPSHVDMPDPNMYPLGFEESPYGTDKSFRVVEKIKPSKDRGDTGYVYHEWEEVKE
jgi:hypothetical protein